MSEVYCSILNRIHARVRRKRRRNKNAKVCLSGDMARYGTLWKGTRIHVWVSECVCVSSSLTHVAMACCSGDMAKYSTLGNEASKKGCRVMSCTH